MTLTLTSKDHDVIYNTVRENFSDFPLFDTLVSEKLRLFLAESIDLDITVKFTKTIFKRYFSHEAFKTPEQRALIYPLELIFQTTCVLITSYRPDIQHLLWNDKKTFLEHYPQFAKGIDSDELNFLLNFRNMMKIALTIIPARLNKGRLLQISGKLEGSHSDYITGSGQRVEVDRRVEIYQQEGKQKVVCKKGRGRHGSQHVTIPDDDDDSDGGSYRLERKKRRTRASSTPRKVYSKKAKRLEGVFTCTSSSFSNNKLKQMVMNDEMVKNLLDTPVDVAPAVRSATAAPVQRRPPANGRVPPAVTAPTPPPPSSPLSVPTRKSSRAVKRRRTISISDVSSDETYSSSASSTSSASEASGSSPVRRHKPEKCPAKVPPGVVRQRGRPGRPSTARKSEENRSAAATARKTQSAFRAAAAGEGEAAAGGGRGRRGRASIVLADKLFPRSRSGAPVIVSGSSHSGCSSQDTDAASHSATTSAAAATEQPDNLHIWHMNMHNALSNFEDLLDLTEDSHHLDDLLHPHSVAPLPANTDVTVRGTEGDDSLMTIFTLLTNKSDHAAAFKLAGGGAVLPVLSKSNALGISTDDADFWGFCGDLDPFTPHNGGDQFSPHHNNGNDSSFEKGVEAVTSGGGWEDGSMILIRDRQGAAATPSIAGGGSASGESGVGDVMLIDETTCFMPPSGLPRSNSGVFNETDAEVLLQIL